MCLWQALQDQRRRRSVEINRKAVEKFTLPRDVLLAEAYTFATEHVVFLCSWWHVEYVYIRRPVTKCRISKHARFERVAPEADTWHVVFVKTNLQASRSLCRPKA